MSVFHYKIFQELTIASTVLDDPSKAFEEIDRVLATALRYKRPVYIEIPRDLLNQPGNPDYQWIPQPDVSDPTSLAAALEETVRLISAAHQPVILADADRILKAFVS